MTESAEPETRWDLATTIQREEWAEQAGLMLRTAFPRNLPAWWQLPSEWRRRLIVLFSPP